MVSPQMLNRRRRRTSPSPSPSATSTTTTTTTGVLRLAAEGRLLRAIAMAATAMVFLRKGVIVRNGKPKTAATVFRSLHVNALRAPGPYPNPLRRRNRFAIGLPPHLDERECGHDPRTRTRTSSYANPYHRRQQQGHSQRIPFQLRPLYSSSYIPEISSDNSGGGGGGDGDGGYDEFGFEHEDGELFSDDNGFDESDGILLRDLNPSQIEAVTQPLRLPHPVTGELRSVVTRVIAGPGSGKTKVLTTRIAYLLNQDRYGKILAVTFTRKAAGEMKERVDRLLREQQEFLAAANGVAAEREQPSENDDDVVLVETADGRVDAEGLGAPDGIERVELGTFHSICAKILRYNGEMLRDLPSVLRDMSKAQPVWVERMVPGGGNDDDGGDDDDDDDDDDGEDREPEKILVDPEIKLNGQYVIIDQGEQIRILNECLKEQKIDLKQSEVKPIQVISAIGKIKETFAQGQDPFVNPKGRGPGATMQMARKIYFKYREKLLMNNAMDFDDLILLTRELLMEDEELRLRLHKRWPHVLVDEYQDTSKVQMDLIKLLTSSSLFVVGDADQSIYSWRGAHVGSLEDVKTEFEAYGTVQTVFLKENYRSTSNIVRAAEKVISSGHPTSVVGEALAEAGIKEEGSDNGNSNSATIAKKDDLRRAMKPKRGTGPSPRVVACEDERAEARFVVDTILEMTANNDLGPGDTVAMIYRTNAQSRYLEEACVQKNLPYVIRGGAGGFYKRAEIKDCLCFLRWLYSGNDEGSMIRAMKTPTKGIGEKGYAEFKEYCDLVQSYLRQNHPDLDRPTYLDVLISMTNNDGVSSDKDYLLPEGTPSPQDHISKRALNNFLKFSAQMRDIRSKAYRANIGKLLLFVIEELKLLDHFDAISKSKSEFLERKENVQELRNAAKKYDSYGPSLTNEPSETDDDDVMGVDSALSSFLDDVALVSDTAEANEKDKDSARLVVNLMTIHASKGTEFDCVFVVGLEEGTLPCNPALQEGANSVQLEEEKRLCYVAMTRAKTRLVLTWRKEVTSFSKWSAMGPTTQSKKRSRFLNAIVSKKSKAKTKSKTKSKADPKRGSKPRVGLRNASTSSRSASGISNGNGNSYNSNSYNSRYVNRTGLKGPNGRRRTSPDASRAGRISPPARRTVSSSASSRREPPTQPQTTRPPAKGKQEQEPFRPSIERVEALRSTLSSSSSSSSSLPPSRVPPPRKSPPQPRSPPKQAQAPRSARRSEERPPRPRSASPASGSNDVDVGVDPMWFFPVGVRVVHMNLGKGTVVEPPPFRNIDDAKVRVRFENGKTLEFPALSSDIVPDMGGF